MTVSSTTNRMDYTGDGVTTDFSFPYVFFEDADLDVYVDDTLKALNSDYTISGTFANGRYASGANVVFAVAPANATSIAIVRDVPYTQEIDYSPYDSFPAETHETGLDKNTIMAQQLLSLIAGALRVPASEASIDRIPTVADRANKYLAFGASGQPIASSAAITAAVTAFIETLLDDANAAEARATLGAAALAVANVFTALQTFQAGLELYSSDDSNATGPDLDIMRHSASPAAGDDMGRIQFWGRDSGAAWQTYAQIRGRLVDPTAGSEDGGLLFRNIVGGVFTNIMWVIQGLAMEFSGSIDPGAGRINAKGYWMDNVAVSPILGWSYTQSGAVATGTTTIPNDDTIPQNTEGTEFMTRAFTPGHANSTLRIEVTAHIASTVAGICTMALFQDADVNAIAAVQERLDGTAAGYQMRMTFYVAAGSTAARTYKVRIGNSAASTLTFNGAAGARLMGGVMASGIYITEIGPNL